MAVVRDDVINGWRTTLRRSLKILAIAWLSVVLLLSLLQRKLIYHPSREPVTLAMAADLGVLVTDIEIVTHDNLRLAGWLARANVSVAESSDNARPLVIYFPGNAAHRGRRTKQIGLWCDLGCDVLIVDYRGYGGNAGSPSEADVARDAEAVWEYATATLHVPTERIVLFGESLGGGVSIGLAHALAERGVQPGGLVIRASFTSLVDVAAWHYPWLPVKWLLVDRYPSLERIPAVKCPLLVLHGDQDEIIPHDQARQLHAAAPGKSANGVPKQFVTLAGAGHNDILYVAYDEMSAALQSFLAVSGVRNTSAQAE
jgi:fermentation-respiration switch protein FrsA (DUF1100 family)